jgi:TonB-dependent receptor
VSGHKNKRVGTRKLIALTGHSSDSGARAPEHGRSGTRPPPAIPIIFNPVIKPGTFRATELLRRSVPAFVACALAGPAFAQDSNSGTESAAELQQVTVTGIRESLKNAQEIKREAEVFVDSVTSEDIGALPDRSVTEALQRIPGVSINRFAAGNDPDHFSVEGTGVVVRGLNAVRSELNGRDTFSANNGRFLSFADVPPELLGAVDVYKNQSADLIEGGLAGTVNLRTLVPFDRNGRVMGFSAEANYGDFAEAWSPTGSALYSDRWQTGIGEVGLLLNGVYSKLKTRSDGAQASSFRPRDDLVPGEEVWVPEGAAFRSQNTNRERKGGAFAAQWASPNDTMKATLQFLRSDASVSWTEFASEIATDVVGDTAFQPVPGTEFDIGDNGVFTNGVITAPTGWRDDQQGGREQRTPLFGLQSNNIRRDVEQRYVTSDYGLNFRWNPNDKWGLNLDWQHVDSHVNNLDFGIWASTFQNASIDLRGDIPRLTYLPPSQNGTVNACVPPTGSCPSYFNGNDASFSDPFNSFWRSAMDHFEDSDGRENAFKVDLERFFDKNESWIDSVRFGARYAERDQTTRFSEYNWGALSEIWGQGGPVWLSDPVDGIPNANGLPNGGGQPSSAQTMPVSFSNFMRGDVPVPLVALYPNFNLAKNYDEAAAFALKIRDEWGRNDVGDWERADDPRRGAHIAPGSPFLPREVNLTNEKTEALYGMLRFGGEVASKQVSGNIGVRWVRTNFDADGSIGALLPSALAGESSCIPPDPPPADFNPPPFCDLSLDERNRLRRFATGDTTASNARTSYHNILPSFNLKVGLSQDLLFRFGFSKAIQRPDLGLTRNYFNLVPRVIDDTFVGIEARTGNAFLEPARATQFDTSLEYYFSEVGSLTFSLFTKRLHDVVTNGLEMVPFTAGGETVDVFVVRPVNSDDVGKVKGGELAYQQFYSMLPGFWSGFGVQANYTYIESKGVRQNTLNTTTPDTAGTEANVDTSLLPLVGLSKHNANFALVYEKARVSTRLAYSWRSQFLLTTRDVITPFAPIMNEATGQLDGSFTYSITDHVKVGVQGVNLLNEVTRTSQVLNNQLLEGGRSWFMNDRRFSLLLRANF